VAGAPMKKPMREILERQGMSREAERHRSRLLAELEWTPDLVICCAPVHMIRVAEILPGVASVLCHPVIPDPAFGGTEGYEKAWRLIQQAADDIILQGASLLMPEERE
jgi:protein-tyrosine-phosphatase